MNFRKPIVIWLSIVLLMRRVRIDQDHQAAMKS